MPQNLLTRRSMNSCYQILFCSRVTTACPAALYNRAVVLAKREAGAHLLHEDGVVTLKGGVNVKVCLHGANLVFCRKALATAALSAVLEDFYAVPGSCCLETAGQHMDCLGIRLWREGNVLYKHCQDQRPKAAGLQVASYAGNVSGQESSKCKKL